MNRHDRSLTNVDENTLSDVFANFDSPPSKTQQALRYVRMPAIGWLCFVVNITALSSSQHVKTSPVKSRFFSTHSYFLPSGQDVVTGVVPSPPWFLPSNFIAHGIQQSHCSSIFASSVANPRSRACRKSICAQGKVPTIFYE